MTETPLGAGVVLKTVFTAFSCAPPLYLKASNVALKRDGPENWASYSSFFIRIKIHKSFWVGRSPTDEQVTCRRGIPPSKNGLSVITKRYGLRYYILYKETQCRWEKLCSACNAQGVNKTVPSIITVLAAYQVGKPKYIKLWQVQAHFHNVWPRQVASNLHKNFTDTKNK